MCLRGRRILEPTWGMLDVGFEVVQRFRQELDSDRGDEDNHEDTESQTDNTPVFIGPREGWPKNQCMDFPQEHQSKVRLRLRYYKDRNLCIWSIPHTARKPFPLGMYQGAHGGWLGLPMTAWISAW